MRGILVIFILHLVVSLIGFMLIYRALSEVNWRLAQIDQRMETTNTQLSVMQQGLLLLAPDKMPQ